MRSFQNIRLRHLRTFLEVARHKSISRAAETLRVTQPAVSKTIRELEDILATKLFDRSHRAIDLTPLGRRFLNYTETSLLSLRQGVEELTEAGLPSVAPLNIGALPTVSARLLPKVIHRYNQRGVRNAPRILTGPNDYLIGQLRDGRVDIVIGRMGNPAEMTGLHFEHLYSECVCLAVRPEHPLARAAPFHPADIGAYEIIMPTKEALIRPALERLLLVLNIPKLNIIAETVSTAFSRSYTLSSNAVWIISEGVVLDDIARGLLVALPVDTSETKGPVGITMRTETQVSAGVDVFAEDLRSIVNSI